MGYKDNADLLVAALFGDVDPGEDGPSPRDGPLPVCPPGPESRIIRDERLPKGYRSAREAFYEQVGEIFKLPY